MKTYRGAGYTRMQRPNEADRLAMIAKFKEMLAVLLDKVDTLLS